MKFSFFYEVCVGDFKIKFSFFLMGPYKDLLTHNMIAGFETNSMTCYSMLFHGMNYWPIRELKPIEILTKCFSYKKDASIGSNIRS